MLRVENQATILNELEQVIKRIYSLRERLGTLAEDFGVHLDRPEVAHPVRGMDAPHNRGITELRVAITEINTQIAQLEFEADRLFAAKAQLFGVSEDRWNEVRDPQLLTEMANAAKSQVPIQPGNFRSHP